MRFTVIPYAERARRYRTLSGKWKSISYVITGTTMASRPASRSSILTEIGDRHDIGQVKIMHAGMVPGYVRIDEEFETLGQGYGSLGQDQSYYETLMELPELVRVPILNALRDVVWDDAIRTELHEDNAYETSLTRSVGDAKFAKQRSLLLEEADLTAFNFTYGFPRGHQDIAGFALTPIAYLQAIFMS